MKAWVGAHALKSREKCEHQLFELVRRDTRSQRHERAWPNPPRHKRTTNALKITLFYLNEKFLSDEGNEGNCSETQHAEEEQRLGFEGEAHFRT